MKHWNWNEAEARATSRVQRRAKEATKLALGAALAGAVLGIHPMNVLDMATANEPSTPRAKAPKSEVDFLDGLL